MGGKKRKKGTRNLKREEEVGVHDRGAVEVLKLLQLQSISVQRRGR